MELLERSTNPLKSGSRSTGREGIMVVEGLKEIKDGEMCANICAHNKRAMSGNILRQKTGNIIIEYKRIIAG